MANNNTNLECSYYHLRNKEAILIFNEDARGEEEEKKERIGFFGMAKKEVEGHQRFDVQKQRPGIMSLCVVEPNRNACR